MLQLQINPSRYNTKAFKLESKDLFVTVTALQLLY